MKHYPRVRESSIVFLISLQWYGDELHGNHEILKLAILTVSHHPSILKDQRSSVIFPGNLSV